VGDVGTYDKHCLILVNHGEKDGSKVRAFAQSLITQVKEATGLVLEPEVNIL
jgi:UDP-N-acetylmuramate dehydrogenase